MFDTLESKCIKQIDITRDILKVLEHSIEPDSTRRNEIRRFTVASCVTRIYGIYEYFVDTSLSDYLDTLAECIAFADLSKEFKTEYRNGISILLGKMDHSKYRSLIAEEVITWYYEALSNQATYKFVTHALIMHEQNLRLPTVEQLCSKLQLKDFRTWIGRHKLIKSLYADQESIYEQLESELKSFIQIRNDASHGSLDDLEGKDNLLRFCELISNVIRVFASFLRKSILAHQIDAEKVFEVGEITEVFKRNGACILVARNNVRLQAGKQCCLLSSSDCINTTIDSMMLEGSSTNGLLTKADNIEIGLKYASEVYKYTKMYLYK